MAVNADAPKIFDCFLYSGEEDILEIRFNELWDAVDVFVVVESNRTFSGVVREPSWNPNSPSLARFSAKVRHVLVRDMPDGDDPWKREAWQRNAVLRGIPDAAPDDLVIMSDADEIPRAETLRELAIRRDADAFGLKMAFHYFFVNYQNVEGDEADITWSVAARRHVLDRVPPDDLRYRLRGSTSEGVAVSDAGWHFSYLSDLAGIKRKISNFSHQELNTKKVLSSIDVEGMVSGRKDLFGRAGFVWDVVDDTKLPAWLKNNRETLSHLFYPPGPIRKPAPWYTRFLRSAKAKRQPPMIICPYVHDRDKEVIDKAFGLSTNAGKRLPFYTWQDSNRIGPEHAFQHCWDQHPDRDIVIVHSDMSPMDGDRKNRWYDALIAQRDALDSAGLIACNLFFPRDGGGRGSVRGWDLLEWSDLAPQRPGWKSPRYGEA